MVQNLVISTMPPPIKKKRGENTVAMMKAVCRERGLKVSGTKDELRRRIEEYNVRSNASSHIKAVWKGSRLRQWLPYQGSILGNFSSRCTNTCDFKTLDELDDIPISKRFAYKDKDGFQYGFHIDSFMEILKRAKTISKNEPPFQPIHYDNKALNPYDRQPIPDADIKRAVCLANRITKTKEKPQEQAVQLNNSQLAMNYVRQVEQFAIETFQRIDEHGHYSNYEWFWNLPRPMIFRFKNEIRDVFNFRAGITPEVKRNILPPHGCIEHIFTNATRAYSKYNRAADSLKQLQNQNSTCRVLITSQNDQPILLLNYLTPTTEQDPSQPPPPPTFFDHTYQISNKNDATHISNHLQLYDLPESSKSYIVRILAGHISRHKNAKHDVDQKYYEFLYTILEAINTLVTSGIDRDSQALGCIYVLGSLTTVSPDAANAIPWLWQSFY